MVQTGLNVIELIHLILAQSKIQMKTQKEEEEEIIEDNRSGYFFNYFYVGQ